MSKRQFAAEDKAKLIIEVLSEATHKSLFTKQDREESNGI